MVYRLFGASSKNIPLPGQLPQPKRFGVGLTVGFTVGLIVRFTVGFNVGFTVGSVRFKRYLVSIIVKPHCLGFKGGCVSAIAQRL